MAKEPMDPEVAKLKESQKKFKEDQKKEKKDQILLCLFSLVYSIYIIKRLGEIKK